jgi:hypothetical protein
VLAIRKWNSEDSFVGEFPVLLGPFRVSDSRDVERVLSEAEFAQMTPCLEFVLFSISADQTQSIALPFKANGYGNHIRHFDSKRNC